MEARRSSSGNLTKSTSLLSRKNDRLVALLLRRTVLLHQADTQAPVIKRVPLPLYARTGYLAMMIGEETERMIGNRTGIGMMGAEGIGTAIEGRLRIRVANGGGIGMMTGIDGGNGMKMGDGTETGRIMVAIMIQTNEIAQETDARGVAIREIKYPCVKVNTLSCRMGCTYASSSRKECQDRE